MPCNKLHPAGNHLGAEAASRIVVCWNSCAVVVQTGLSQARHADAAHRASDRPTSSPQVSFPSRSSYPSDRLATCCQLTINAGYRPWDFRPDLYLSLATMLLEGPRREQRY